MGKWICGLDEEWEKFLNSRLAIQEYAFQHGIDVDIMYNGKIKDSSKLRLYANVEGNDEIEQTISYVENFKEMIQDRENGERKTTKNKEVQE